MNPFLAVLIGAAITIPAAIGFWFLDRQMKKAHLETISVLEACHNYCLAQAAKQEEQNHN